MDNPPLLIRRAYAAAPRARRRDMTRLVTAAPLRARMSALQAGCPLAAEGVIHVEQYAMGDKIRSRRMREILREMLGLTGTPLGNWVAARYLMDTRRHPVRMWEYSTPWLDAPDSELCGYIRCVFRPGRPDPFRLSPDTRRLLESCLVDRDYESMPILADACEDDGCTSPEMLRHLREDAHCWGCGALTALWEMS